MGELRLYAIGIDEVRDMFGAAPADTERLRAIAAEAFAPQPTQHKSGLIGRLGPLFRRAPDAPVISATAPTPQDVNALLTGAYIPPDRVGAAWRIIEVWVQQTAWGSTRLNVSQQSLDDLDFALARGGVSAAVGLRHLLSSGTQLNLLPVHGLTVGYHRHQTALDMSEAYRKAMPEVKTEQQQEIVAALVRWLDGFLSWADVAGSLGRPAPDLVGFWAN